MAESFYADWMIECLVSDDAFSQAYNAMPGARRAWIKKTAAQVHALVGSMRDRREERTVLHRQGFSSRALSAPLDCAVIFLDSTCVSPVQVAAAAVPLILSGAGSMCAVRIEDGLPISDNVLAALELVGLETVFRLDEPGARRFMERLTETGSAAVLFFGRGTALTSLSVAAGYAAPPLKLFKPFVTERLGVWTDSGDEWDYETLAWAHPCTLFEVWGARAAIPDLPPGFSHRKGSFESFLAEGYKTVFVSEGQLAESVGRAALALAPGQEGCWVWPELSTGFFRSETLAIGGWNG